MKRNENSIGIELPELLEVVVQTSPHKTEILAATLCRYVVANAPDGRRITGIEVVYDPKVRAPAQSYFCPLRRMKYLTIRPGDLKSVRPYLR